jgi:hypothetical protein
MNCIEYGRWQRTRHVSRNGVKVLLLLLLLLSEAAAAAVVVDEGLLHFPITVIVTIMVRKIDVPHPEEGVVAVTGRVVMSRVVVVERGVLVEAVAVVAVPRKYVLHRKSIALLGLRRHPSVLHPRALRIVSTTTTTTTKAVRHPTPRCSCIENPMRPQPL